jgi:hypothetical protein
LAGASYPNNLDGIDIGPLLSADVSSIDRDVFLYFNGWDLQCARYGPYKLHMSRGNTYPWSPAPAGGDCNLPLPQPELYNVETDPGENYDVAPLFPDVVADITARVRSKLPAFPADVMNAWNNTMRLRVQSTAIDSLPALATP